MSDAMSASHRLLLQALAGWMSALLFCSGGPTATAAQTDLPFERALPHVNLGVLGQAEPGLTLSAAIASVAARREPARATDPSAVREFTTANRHYALVHAPERRIDYVRSMITGTAPLDGAILVVSVADGLTPRVREHVRLARQVGVRSLVVFLDGVDTAGDAARLQTVERDVRGLLTSYEYPGTDTPVITGTAARALAGAAEGERSIERLLATVDEYVPLPVPDAERPFMMPIEDTFSIAGRGTVATGRIERGGVAVGDEVDIVGFGSTQTTVATGVAMFGRALNQAQAGDNVGLLLRGVERSDLQRGQVLAQPASIAAHRTFEAEVYVLTAEEGGRAAPFVDGYRPQFYFRTTDVTGVVRLPAGVEMAMPGDSVAVRVELALPVALEKALRFAVREGGRTVGAGIVTEILE